MLHAGASVQSAEMVWLSSECHIPLQVSAAIETGSSPGPQAAVMYALQLALITDKYCEPQAPGVPAGPDPDATTSEELPTMCPSSDDATDDVIGRGPLQAGRPMASWYAM